VTRQCFTTQEQTYKAKTKTKTDYFLVSDRSCPKTDGLRPHHWFMVSRSLDACKLNRCLPLFSAASENFARSNCYLDFDQNTALSIERHVYRHSSDMWKFAISTTSKDCKTK